MGGGGGLVCPPPPPGGPASPPHPTKGGDISQFSSGGPGTRVRTHFRLGEGNGVKLGLCFFSPKYVYCRLYVHCVRETFRKWSNKDILKWSLDQSYKTRFTIRVDNFCKKIVLLINTSFTL